MSSKRSLLSLNLPKETLRLLARKGYENIQDVRDVNPENLASELGLPLQEIESIVGASRAQATPSVPLALSQAASKMLTGSQKIKAIWPSLDAILGDGLTRGHMLELSGPPGCPKEALLMKIVVRFAQLGEDVLFVDCANMFSPFILKEGLSADCDLCQRIRFINICSTAELLVFCHQLIDILSSHPKISLVTFGSLSFLFQGHNFSPATKNSHLEKVKQCFSKLCSRDVTIITTSQLATKMVNADGSKGTFESGGRGVMHPQLSTTYHVDGKTWRVLVCPEDPTTGHLKLLSSPKHPPGNDSLGLVERYSLVRMSVVDRFTVSRSFKPRFMPLKPRQIIAPFQVPEPVYSSPISILHSPPLGT